MTAQAYLSDVSLEGALDSLLSDYLEKIDVLFQAYSDPSTSSGTALENDLIKLHSDAVERRKLVGMFEDGMNVSGPAYRSGDDVPGQPVSSDLVKLHETLQLNEEELEVWRQWRPEIDDTVLIYLSPERGYWPGKIIDLGYFSTLALPRIHRSRMFAVRIYPTKQHPIITIKSHLIPLSLRPRAPRNAPSTLMKAYRTAASPLLYDIEALGLELNNRSTWGADPTGLNMNGKTWFAWKDWIERQARSESALDRSPRGGMSGRDRIKTEALAILQDLESRGHAVFALNLEPSMTGQVSEPDPIASSTPSKGEIKRARKRLTEALTDPVIGPALNRLQLGEVCRTLVPATNESHMNDFPDLAPDNHGPSICDDQIQVEAIDHVLGKKRKREEPGDDASMDMDFVNPLTGQVDEEEGWSVVKRNRRR